MFIPLRPTEEAIEVAGKLEEPTFQDLFKKCVQAFIILGQERATIKKADLNRIAFPNVHFKTSGAIIQFANKELNKTFGMRIYELDDKSRYLLVNSKPGFTNLTTTHDDTICKELTVMYFVLIEIFVSPDEKVGEDKLLESLNPLDMTSEEIVSHLDSFVKKLYLVQEKKQDMKFYSWGPRFYAEVEPEEFFNRFLSLAGDTSDKDWPDLRKRIDKLKTTLNR